MTIHIACESQKGNNPFKICISDLFILSVFRIHFLCTCVFIVCAPVVFVYSVNLYEKNVKPTLYMSVHVDHFQTMYEHLIFIDNIQNALSSQ